MSIAGNLAAVRARARGAVLVAVSKTQTRAALLEALQAGQMVFGENRVQEAREKFPPLRALYPALKLHLLGPLQTNKVPDAVELFDVIETLDRPKLVEALAAAMKKTGRQPRLYIEVNIAGEPQKTGIAPENLGGFLAYCRDQCGLKISGLMCIPPQAQDPRPHFRAMRKLADNFALEHLSMGMSADFEIAVECGATEVRIGTAIFGKRIER